MNRRALSSVDHGGNSSNKGISDLSYHSSKDEDGYDSDDDDDDGGEDSASSRPSLEKHKKPLSLKRPSRRHREEHHVDRKHNRHSRRLPYRLPEALFLPPRPLPTLPPLRRCMSIQPLPPSSEREITDEKPDSLFRRKASFMVRRGVSKTRTIHADPPEEGEEDDLTQLYIMQQFDAKKTSQEYHHHQKCRDLSSSYLKEIDDPSNTKAVSRMAHLMDPPSFVVPTQESEDANPLSTNSQKPRRMTSMPLLRRGRNPDKSEKSSPSSTPPPVSLFLSRRSKSIAKAFGNVVSGIRGNTAMTDTINNTELSRIPPDPHASPTFLARRSNSIAKTFGSVLGSSSRSHNCNSSDGTPTTTAMTTTQSLEIDDVWIERVKIRHRGQQPLHFYFESVFSKNIQSEPPTGAVHVIYLDELWTTVGFIQQQQSQHRHRPRGWNVRSDSVKNGQDNLVSRTFNHENSRPQQRDSQNGLVPLHSCKIECPRESY